MNVVETEHAAIVEPEGSANATIIWLHGLGADGYDFLPIVPDLRLLPGVSARFVFPHAPARPVTLNGGMVMRAWYDISGLSRTEAEDGAGIRASAALVAGLIAEQVAAGVPRSRIVLAGFSQGGAMALHTGLRQAEALAGIMALSTYVPLEAAATREVTAAARATPVLMCHGREDPVLALGMGEHSRDLLLALGLNVDWHDYPMGHQVSPEEIGDISRWLQRRLA